MTASPSLNRRLLNAELPVRVRSAQQSDLPIISSWVGTTHDLKLISGEVADHLSVDIVRKWVGDSVSSLVLVCRDEPVAFCTLSTTEYSLPHSNVEACHLVVDPEHRRRYFGTAILAHARLVAAQHSFIRLVGRVVNGNDGAVRFTHYARWKDFGSNSTFDPKYHWCFYDLRR